MVDLNGGLKPTSQCQSCGRGAPPGVWEKFGKLPKYVERTWCAKVGDLESGGGSSLKRRKE